MNDRIRALREAAASAEQRRWSEPNYAGMTFDGGDPDMDAATALFVGLSDPATILALCDVAEAAGARRFWAALSGPHAEDCRWIWWIGELGGRVVEAEQARDELAGVRHPAKFACDCGHERLRDALARRRDALARRRDSEELPRGEAGDSPHEVTWGRDPAAVAE